MKKFLIKVAVLLAFQSCNNPISDSTCKVFQVRNNNDDAHKYVVEIYCARGYLTLLTDTLYSVGDTVKISKKR